MRGAPVDRRVGHPAHRRALRLPTYARYDLFKKYLSLDSEIRVLTAAAAGSRCHLVLPARPGTATRKMSTHTYLAQGLTVITKAVPPGRDGAIAHYGAVDLCEYLKCRYLGRVIFDSRASVRAGPLLSRTNTGPGSTSQHLWQPQRHDAK
jgi:hypothetical protein